MRRSHGLTWEHLIGWEHRMGVGRVSSLFAATVLAAGMSMVVTPAAFADGVKDCVDQAKGLGVKAPDAGQACSYAHGGDGADCASMVQNDTGPAVSDESADEACAKAAPPPAPTPS
jgi:hypothetical protein